MHKVFLTSDAWSFSAIYCIKCFNVLCCIDMRYIQQHARFIQNEQSVYNVFMHDGLQFVGFSVFLLRVAINLSLATGSFYHIYV